MANRRQRRKQAAKNRRATKPAWVEECLPVTVEQFELACKVAHAASTGQMPRQSFASKYEEDKARGEVPEGPHFVMGDRPINHAMFAILECFPDKSEAGHKFRQSVLWRTLFMAGQVYRDPRTRVYMKTEGNDEFVGSPLVEAMATVPTNMGEDAPLDAIFAKAAQLALNWKPDEDVAA